ncbi:MAG: hypothetical protein WA417_24835 [Stellaceae bacterium]
MSLTGLLLPWLPPLLVAILSASALVAAGAGVRGRRSRLMALAVIGGLALAATVWQAKAGADRVARLVAQDRTKQLTAEVEALQRQLEQVKQSTRLRSLSADTAIKLADYLRAFGRHKVVVSCAPNDIEAYRYATQIADVLKTANWDASGPETTAIFGDVRAMGINVYNNSAQPSDTVKILLDGLAKFGIPYQSRVPPSEALPETETVELFVGAKPGPAAAAVGNPR